jgi:hypothetical protein
MKNLACLIAVFPALLSLSCGSDDPKEATGSTTYLLEIPNTRWTEPPGIGQDVANFVDGFLFQVDPDGTTTIGLASGGQQDMCTPTSTLQSNGTDIGPGEIVIHLVPPAEAMHDAEVNATIKNFTLAGVLPQGGTPAEAGELTALADARELWPLFYQLINPDETVVCNALDQNGAPCEACEDGEMYCLNMKATGLGATAVNMAVETVTEACPEVIPAD